MPRLSAFYQSMDYDTTEIICKKNPLQKSIVTTKVHCSTQLAINKKQKYFSLPNYQLAENLILVFGS